MLSSSCSPSLPCVIPWIVRRAKPLTVLTATPSTRLAPFFLHGRNRTWMFSIELEPPGDPNPGYFEFDWLSARHPDLYDRFALSTVGLMHELRSVVDLTGLIVCDVGAGTGRSALGAAETASR